MLTAREVSFGYNGGLILDGVAISAGAGEVVGLIGPNGSGKTTLLRVLLGALHPRAGLVSLDETPVAAMRPAQLARRLGVVAQEAPAELPLSVADLVLLGRAVHRSAWTSYTAADHRAAAAALHTVGARHLADRSFVTLSGGEKQRVLIARTLCQEADHLLLDEPTNHLDIRYQHEILDLVRSLEVTTVLVLHELNLAARYCDRLVLLDGGRVAAAGPVADVLDPAVLEPVYRVDVQRLDIDGCPQLLFRLHRPHAEKQRATDSRRVLT